MKVLLFILLCWNSVNFSKQNAQAYPFQDVSLPWSERVDDIVKRLSADEIIQQLSHGGAGPLANPSPPIPRLGIGPYPFDTECLRGDVSAGLATSFPQAIGLAASFSRQLIYDVATATSIEVRAKYNNFTAHADHGDHHGLSCFSPVINIMRHPTWGRNQETYGEDPYLSGQLAAAFVRGLQGGHPRYVRASAGCKHFDVHGGPEDKPVSRFSFDAKVSAHDWHMTFLPQFHECVRAGSLSLMCSYNSINGVPACANRDLLTRVLREEWGFTGYVVSDEEAIRNVQGAHHYTNDSATTAAVCLHAGTNLELVGPWIKKPGVFSNLTLALSRGLIDEELLAERLRPLFYTRMRLGEFDPPHLNPYSKLTVEDTIHSPQHQELSITAATKTFVLLQNKGVLPIKSQLQQVAIVGPLANQGHEVYGDYTADFDPKFSTSLMSSINSSNLAQRYRWGAFCKPPLCSDYDRSSLLQAMTGAQLVLVAVGTGSYEHEDKDRPDMLLPGNQTQLLNDVIKYAPAEASVILLLFSAGPLQLPDAAWSRAAAVLQLHFPAQAAGSALLKVLTGEANPGGRLPYTWYRDINQVPPMTNYTMHSRTYRYLESWPLFPFGFGLSYTKFQYSSLHLQRSEIAAGEELRLSVVVGNVGDMAGDEVVQLYVEWPHDERLPHPNRQLGGFERVSLQVGERRELSFTLRAESMQLWTPDNVWSVPPGVYTVSVGGQQPEQHTLVPSNVLQAKFHVK